MDARCEQNLFVLKPKGISMDVALVNSANRMTKGMEKEETESGLHSDLLLKLVVQHLKQRK